MPTGISHYLGVCNPGSLRVLADPLPLPLSQPVLGFTVPLSQSQRLSPTWGCLHPDVASGLQPCLLLKSNIGAEQAETEALRVQAGARGSGISSSKAAAEDASGSQHLPGPALSGTTRRQQPWWIPTTSPGAIASSKVPSPEGLPHLTGRSPPVTGLTRVHASCCNRLWHAPLPLHSHSLCPWPAA